MADRLRAVGAGARMSASEQASLVTLLAHPDRPVSWLGRGARPDQLGGDPAGGPAGGGGLGHPVAGQRRAQPTAAADRRGHEARAVAATGSREAVLADAVAGLSDTDRAELERLLEPVVGALAED